MKPKLIRHPEKYHNESLEGYLLRLSILNFTQQKHFGINRLMDYSEDHDFEKYINQVTILTEHKYGQEHLMQYWYKKGLTLPGWSRFKFTRYCPICLKDLCYHRFNWSITNCTYCYKHQIFLIENCEACNKKIQLQDVISGKCVKCDNSILKAKVVFNNFEKETIVCNETEDLEDISYFTLLLSKEEYLILIHWTSYFIGSKIVGIQFTSLESKRFLYFGYLTDVIQQYKINKMATDLLSGWPSAMVSLLHNQFNGDLDKVKEFMKFLIHGIRDTHIKEILLSTYTREKGFGSPNIIINDEQLSIDKNYIPIDDLIQHLKIKYHTLKEFIVDRERHFLKHPRNKTYYLFKKEVEKLIFLKHKRVEKESEDYISNDEVAYLWNTDAKSVLILIKYFDVMAMPLLDEEYYSKTRIIDLIEKTKKLITDKELSDKTIWHKRTIRMFMKSMNVSNVNDHILYDEIYNRDEAMTVLDKSSSDLDLYMDLRAVMNALGKELFKAAQLDPYYMNFYPFDKPYYLKSDVERIKNLYDGVNEIKKIDIIRTREKLSQT
jgi:hypothetical protein